MKIPILVFIPSLALAQSYSISPFDYPGATATVATAINNSGQVLGIYTDSSNANHCFLRGSDGTFTTLTDPPGAIPRTIGCSGLNNLGQTAGDFQDPNGWHAYIRSASGAFTVFDAPGPNPWAVASGINDRGDVVGLIVEPTPTGGTGFLRAADGTFTSLPNPAIGQIAPLAINNRDEIAGWVLNGSSQGTQHGFLRTPDGVYAKFDLPGTTGYTRINAVNNVGQFAGNLVGGPGFASLPDGSFALLNVMQVSGINDSGQVTGSLSDRNFHGFIGTPGPGLTQPAIRTLVPGIMPASAFSSAISSNANTFAPGTWIEIYGQNLASTTRSWRVSDFHSGVAPTAVDGVTVTIGGTPAFVSYVSPGQVNALVPSTVAPGTTSLTVANGALTSAPVNVTVVASQPAVLTVPPLDDPRSAFLAALYPDLITYALPSSYTNVPTRTPHPGDTIVLFGTGFGPVAPDVPVGRIATQPTGITAPVKITFTGDGPPIPGTVTYAGLAPGTVGLYQFNVVIPNVSAPGTVVSVAVSLNGNPIQGLFLSVPFGN